MEIKITTNQILAVLQILSCIIFIGLCIDAGAIAASTLFTLFNKPLIVENSWEASDYLSILYKFDHGHFYVIKLIMTIVAVLKAIMFYLIVKLFVEKKLNISQPFSSELRQFILLSAYLALGISMFSHYGYKYSFWLTKQGIRTADLQSLHIAGADVWLFMSVIFFVIVQIIKKGIEIQQENDLTI
jgi:hypothetical protein